MVSNTQETVENFFINTVVPLLPVNTPISYDNVQIKVPEDTSVWLKHSIQEDDNSFNALGKKSTRKFGSIIIQIFTKKNVGAQQANSIADIIDTSYAGSYSNCVHFQVPVATTVGVIGAYFQKNIIIPFYEDQTRS